MNIILSKTEKHPMSQAVYSTIDMMDKRIMYVYGLSSTRGNYIVSSTDMRTNSVIHNKGFSAYSFDEGNTPEIVKDVCEFWKGLGFNILCIGVGRSIRDTLTDMEYSSFLTSLYRSVFTDEQSSQNQEGI